MRQIDVSDSRPIAVTGASGYIGGRLVSGLLEAGHRVRCLVRSPRKLEGRPWFGDPRVEVVQSDLTSVDATTDALRGCRAAYYLVHSMLAVGRSYADADHQLADRFARAAAAADIDRILYLGGLGEMGEDLSEHLSSRRQVETALGAGPVPVTVLRAAMIIGSGSASFEILRYLVERLPVMVTPRWVHTECQPIAVRDVLFYLTECLRRPQTRGQTLDIGGPDVVTYLDLIHTIADLRGLGRRWVIPVPVLTPRLSSLWIHLVTPLSARIARPLADGMRNRVVCRDERAQELMPRALLTVREAIERAFVAERQGRVETRWSDAGVIAGDPDWAGGTVFVDPRRQRIQATAPHVFAAICRVGGGHGYYGADWLWRLRGAMDRLVGRAGAAPRPASSRSRDLR